MSNLVEAADWAQLMRADQLKAAQQAGDAFVGFSEGEMNFAPTFKVLRREGVRCCAGRGGARGCSRRST